MGACAYMYALCVCANIQYVKLMMVNNNLVGGAITILKNMSSSMGRMTTHIEMDNKKCLKPPASN